MTNERNIIDPGADTDAGVTRAYRDTKDEHAPDGLNRTILDQAAKAARPRYSQIRLWTRPMAWAATVMLSVAIVLQLTQTPTPDEIGLDEGIYEAEALVDMPADRLEETTDTAQKTEALRSTAKQVAPAALSETRQREQQSKGMISEPAARAPASSDPVSLEVDNNAFEFKNQYMLQRADDMAAVRESEIQEVVPATSPSLTVNRALETVGNTSADSAADRCDETATAAPETWLKCIATLEEAGLTDAADEERKRLVAAFPDFDIP